MVSAECNDERVCPATSRNRCIGIDGGALQQRIIRSLHLLQGQCVVERGNGDLAFHQQPPKEFVKTITNIATVDHHRRSVIWVDIPRRVPTIDFS